LYFVDGFHRIPLVTGAQPLEARRFFKNHGFVDSGMIRLRTTFSPQPGSDILVG